MESKLYDYRELAYDLYKASDELLDKLVDMRKMRGMSQSDLAEAMNISQSYVSQIENGRKQLVSLLTDYALEVGARIEYVIEPAEDKPEGKRHYMEWKSSGTVPAVEEWGNDYMTMEDVKYSVSFEMPKNNSQQTPKQINLMVGGKPEAAAANVQESVVTS